MSAKIHADQIESDERLVRRLGAVRMEIATLLIAFLTVSAGASAGDTNPRPNGRNCDLASPPADAGEEMSHGTTLRVYPRAKDIDSKYSGCQVLFAPNAEKWAVVSLTEVVKGDPVRVWAGEPDPAMDCRFKQGKVVRGDPGKCPMPEFLLLKSMAPGCVEIVREAVATHGLGAPRPRECDDQ
jgi:hypothetical protein